MAAINFDDMHAESDNGLFASILNWAGALLSVLLIAGLATWGWKLWQRDVAGIPVVRALEGPMRVTPDDPGGSASAYQGLAVNRIAEERSETLVEQVVLAPAPAVLNEDEDLATSDLAPLVEPETLPVAEMENAPDLAGLAAQDQQPVEEVAAATTAPAVEEAVAGPSATDLAVAAALSDVGELQPTPASLTVQAGPGVPVMTPRPIGRPSTARMAAITASQSPSSDASAARAIEPGTRLIQLGAYGSRDVAEAEWANATARFGDYLVGKEHVVQEAQTGGRTFYRLRASGFDSLADARRFCAVLVSDGANCIPVVQE
ncbi:MAG: SPOR domain-containing protein [Boseongicola sp.]|nr:SPOR domain-containing protein [Boseongicola sp.]